MQGDLSGRDVSQDCVGVHARITVLDEQNIGGERLA